MAEGELAVLFRNNHFATLHLRGRALYTLVTDQVSGGLGEAARATCTPQLSSHPPQGYLREGGVVWERLDNVDGDTTYHSADFRTHEEHSAAREAETQEYLARLALQEQVESNAASEPGQSSRPLSGSLGGGAAVADTTQSDHDLALALHLHEQEQQRVAAEERERRQLTASQAAQARPAPAPPSTQSASTAPGSGLSGVRAGLNNVLGRASGCASSGNGSRAKKSDCSIM